MRPRSIPLSLLLLAALAAPAQQDEGRVYFSVSTDRPIRPGETAAVRVHAQGLDRLQFRLYRVNSPEEFFRKLDDPHNFGGAVRPSPGELTPIEKFASWKRRWRTRVRNIVRAQFNATNRTEIRRALLTPKPMPPSAPGRADQYASVPLLNPQQVVRVWEQPVRSAHRWDTVTVPVEIEEGGLYLIEATDGSKQAYTIISVTPLALVTKALPGRLLVRLVDRSTGAPVAGARINVTARGENAWTAGARTTLDGVAQIPVEGRAADSLTVLGRRGDDLAVSTVGGWSFGNEARRSLTGYVYTDRPVYRPGHTVHFKSILRHATLDGYDLPKTSAAQVEIQDQQGRSVFRKSLPVSAVGTAFADFNVPDNASLGYYHINVSLAEGGGVHGGFHVEEYRKPDYEVRVIAAQPRVLQDERAKLTVRARYYYGEPVAGARITWAVYRARYHLPWYADEADPLDFEGADEGYAGEQLDEGEGQLDAEGTLAIEVPTTRGEHDYRYRVEARVTDSSNREISGSGYFLATRGPFYVHAAPGSYVVEPGDNARILVETRDYEGQMVPGVKFDAQLLRYSWESRQRQALQTVSGVTGDAGKGAVEFTIRQGGSYIVRVVARGPRDEEIAGQTWLWVSGEGAWGARQQRVQIVPDKSSYQAGETARVLVVTGVPGAHVWLTVEGRGIYWSRFVQTPGATASVNIPVEAKWAPNVFVEAVFLHENTLFRGSKALKVPPLEKQIQVELSTPKDQYQPGEPAAFTIQARDHQGRPVAGEFSLGVVDEAIYAVKREMQSDITQVFYGRQWNRVQTDSSMHYYFYGEAGTRRIELAKLRPSGARAQLKPERLAEPRIRKEFPDTVHWVADLRTGADGRAAARVTFPDSLTTWRATTRGVTADTRVGQALHRTVVRKNLVLSIAAPRFLGEGDEITIPVLVRNYLPSAKTVRVSMQAHGLELIEGATRAVQIENRGEGRADFRYRVPPGQSKATLLAQALGDEESDAMEITLPVEPAGLKWRETAQGVLSASDGTKLQRRFDARSAPHSRVVEIQLTPSVAGAIFGALDYLITYPYGCTEQTMSSFLPNVIVSQALRQLSIPSPVDEPDLRRKVQAGLERLYSFQHADGGWGWWQGDESDPFMTAYVASGLRLAADAGYPVARWRTDRAAELLEKMLVQNGRKYTADITAWQLYALSRMELATAQQLEQVWARRGEFTPLGWALAGITAQQLRDARAEQAAQHLETSARREGGEAWWPAERDLMLDFEQDATPEATAFVLKFLTAMNRSGELLDQAAQWLVAHRNEGHYWSSTKQTAFVIFGLTDYLQRSGELRPDLAVSLKLNGRQILTRRFAAADALSPAPVKLRLPGAETGESYELEVEKKGQGRVYWSVREEMRLSADGVIAPEEWPMRITREYFRLRPSRDGRRVTYSLEPLQGPVEAGALLAVRLSVQGAAQRFVVIEDTLPSGAEVVPRDDLYDMGRRPGWWRSWYERRELRDSRVTYFPTFLPKQGAEYTYLLRVTNKGTLRIPPARVEPMYRPGYVSATQGAVLEVR